MLHLIPPRGLNRRVHLVRHGNTENPDCIQYGRLPGFHLDELGRLQGRVTGQYLKDSGCPVTAVVSSPLERAFETAGLVAAGWSNLAVASDDRLLEWTNHFEGYGQVSLLNPVNLWKFRNPLRPSWAEPYEQVADRMEAAVRDALAMVGGGNDVVVVSHEITISIFVRKMMGLPLWHDPARRRCALASLTSLEYSPHGALLEISYREPAPTALPEPVEEASA